MYFDQHALPEFLQLSAAQRKEIIDRKVDGTRDYFRRSGYERAVLGLSGGIDSAVALAIAVRGLGRENVDAIMMPYGQMHAGSMIVAQEVALSVGLPFERLHTHDITGRVDRDWRDLIKDFSWFGTLSERQIAFGNLAARARGATLMHWGTVYHALVFGTENRTEAALAYYTKGGDNLTDFEPFLDLWKVQISMIGEALGLPESVLDKCPSAELWDEQTDEIELGVLYPDIDTVLAGRYDEGLTEAQIVQEYGVAMLYIERVLGRVAKMRGKRQSPYELDVTGNHKFLDF